MLGKMWITAAIEKWGNIAVESEVSRRISGRTLDGRKIGLHPSYNCNDNDYSHAGCSEDSEKPFECMREQVERTGWRPFKCSSKWQWSQYSKSTISITKPHRNSVTHVSRRLNPHPQCMETENPYLWHTIADFLAISGEKGGYNLKLMISNAIFRKGIWSCLRVK